MKWIECKDMMPQGIEREVFAVIQCPQRGSIWNNKPEVKIVWWKHGPSCFAFDEFENANHLVTKWMEIPAI